MQTDEEHCEKRCRDCNSCGKRSERRPSTDGTMRCERQRESTDDSGNSSNVARTVLQYRMSKCDGHLEPMMPAIAQRPVAKPKVPNVVQDQESDDGIQRRESQPEEQQAAERTGRQPRRPHQSIANGSQRPNQRRAESFDAHGIDSIDFNACECTNRKTGKVWMRIEVRALPRQRLSVRVTANSTR